ncbi:MAG: hypothetical protein KC486_12990 [Myxococcales bacterium]|nr:hypothetical protein [Myxococcales bacterium]
MRCAPWLLSLACLGLAACDADPAPNDGPAPTFDSGVGDPNENADVPGSHEGDRCVSDILSYETPDEPQICGDDGLLGVEVCVDDAWSRCFTEPCKQPGATRPCGADESAGMIQRCVELDGFDPFWGECAEDICEPGETIRCVDEFEGTVLGEFVNCLTDPAGASYINPNACDFDTTPLVLAFAGTTPTFTAEATAAAFDAGSRGRCEAPDWPTAATPWLARDLDRSGTIDGGHELFGSGTRLADGTYAAHGFAALGALDSDGDGAITPADAAWSELVVWADADADRRTSGWELLPLAAYGIDALAIDFRVDVDCDARGNCSRERAPFSAGAGGLAGELVDVHLVCD